MRILIASDLYYPGVNGAAYFTYRLANWMAKDGNGVVVIAPSNCFRNLKETEDGVTVYRVKSFGLPFYNSVRVAPTGILRFHIRNIVREFNPQVVHVQSHFMIGKTVIEEARKLGIPSVGTNHFMPENLVHYLHLPKSIEQKVIRLAWMHFKSIYKNLDFVTAPTRTAVDLLKSIGFSKETSPISCGIDLSRFNPKNDGKYLLERYNIPQNVPIILFVGRLDKEKNVDSLIKAMPLILRIQRVQLVLAGGGVLRGKLEKLVKKMNLSKQITFTGFVPDEDLPNLYAIAQVFVAPGGAELQCITALEAIASGLPLVAADAIALPELVPDNKNGYLFNLKDFRSLADRILMILSDKKLAIKMKKESLMLASSHDYKKVQTQFYGAYQKAIAINSLNRASIQARPLFISRGLVVKIAFAVFLIAILFKNSLSSPAVVKAKGVYLKDRIESFKVVKDIKNLDEKFKTTLIKK